MGMALEVLTGNATAPSSTLTPLTMAPNDSNTIRSTALGPKICLVSAWALNNAVGTFVIKSPRMHDNVQGIRMNVRAAHTDLLYPGSGWPSFQQPLYPQDQLSLLLSGSATSGQIETASILVYYADLPGVSGRFVMPDMVRKNGLHDMGQEVDITGGTAGGYSGAAAVNSNFDNWKANTDYALLGYEVSAQGCTLGIRGIDVGNLRIGGPCNPDLRHVTADWFVRLSNLTGLPLVPVFNSQNKNAITIDIATSQVSISPVVILHFIELKAGSAPQTTNPAGQ